MDNAPRAIKQSSINTSIVSLHSSIERLEVFVAKVRDNNQPKPMQDSQDKKEKELSLSEFLSCLPEVMNTFDKRIQTAIEDLQQLLY